MVLLFDTREQDTARLRARLASANCKTERTKLDYGDYSAKFPLSDGSWLDLRDKVAIERKMSLDEIAACYTSQRERFRAEFERAKEAGAKVYLLIENATFEKAYKGEYRSKMLPQSLIASALAWLARYNCQLLFCKPETTGKLIHDVLYREGKEILEGGADNGNG